MKRRVFLQAAFGAPILAGLSSIRGAAAANTVEDWRTYVVVTTLKIAKPSGISRAWIPLPFTEKSDWHIPMGNTWVGNGREIVITEPKYGAQMLYVEWAKNETRPSVEVTSCFATRGRAVDISKADSNLPGLSQREMEHYTASTDLIPTDGIVRETARDITHNARTDIEKAYAIYEWVVENAFRDPKVRGCGWGDIKTMLETRYFGGKCGDLNTLFVGLARSVGVAARDVYGIRIAPSALGYQSLGLSNIDASKAQHCRAEFFAQGVGWVPVDPADVRKVVLEEPPGHLTLDDPKVVAIRKRLFGAWEMNWLAYNTAHDVVLPNSKIKIPYFMYPNGVTGQKILDQLEPDSFRYKITARQMLT